MFLGIAIWNSWPSNNFQFVWNHSERTMKSLVVSFTLIVMVSFFFCIAWIFTTIFVSFFAIGTFDKLGKWRWSSRPIFIPNSIWRIWWIWWYSRRNVVWLRIHLRGGSYELFRPNYLDRFKCKYILLSTYLCVFVIIPTFLDLTRF